MGFWALRIFCAVCVLLFAHSSDVCDSVASLQTKSARSEAVGWNFGSSTQFGEGEAVWPNAGEGEYNNWYIDRINSRTGPWAGTRQTFPDGSSAIRAARVGAAIPWPIVMNIDFAGDRGRKSWIKETIKQAQGQGAKDIPPLCYMIQPVNTFAYTESGEPVDFNDPTVLAESKTGENYVYLVAPYEGCGGDGQEKMETTDCFNSCKKIQDVTNVMGKPTDTWLSEMKEICSDPATGCGSLCSLWNGTGFDVLKLNEPNAGRDFVSAGSCMLGISYGTDYARDEVAQSNKWVKENWGVDLDASASCRGHWNYCSGSNGHFDLAVNPDPKQGFGVPWLDQYDAEKLTNMAGDSSGQNIMLRWIPARCDEWGTWTPGMQECHVARCSLCTYGNPQACDRCVAGSEVQPDGTCSEMPDSGKCSDLGLPDDNKWLKIYCQSSWATDGTHALPKGMCPKATDFCTCLTTIKLWAKEDPEKAAVNDYMHEHCSADFLQKSRVSPPPGLGAGGNPESAYFSSDQEVHFDDATVACADSKWRPDSSGIWSFKQIAEAFMEYGTKKFYKSGTGPDPLTQCVGALVTAAGECQETTQSLGVGCDAAKTGESGVFQLDFLRSAHTNTGAIVNAQIKKDGGMMNLCISGFGAGYITGAPFITPKETVYGLEGDSFLTCMGAPLYVNNYSCPDPKAVPGELYTNYLGTFCHKGYASRWSSCNIHQKSDRCCGVFNGGANDFQTYPFPDYYYEKANEHLAAGADFKATCEEVIADML